MDLHVLLCHAQVTASGGSQHDPSPTVNTDQTTDHGMRKKFRKHLCGAGVAVAEGGSHLRDLATSLSYLKPVGTEEFPQPGPEVQGWPGRGDRASLGICTSSTALALR